VPYHKVQHAIPFAAKWWFCPEELMDDVKDCEILRHLPSTHDALRVP